MTFAKPEELDFNRAYAAHYNTSFSPSKRAKQTQDEFADTLNAVYEEMAALAETPEQKEVLAREMARYKEGYLKHFLAYLDARSRCLSPMITGPARFPVAQNEKRSRTANTRRREFLEWSNKAEAAIKKALLAARSPEAVFDDEFESLSKELVWYHSHGFKTHAAGKIQRLAGKGNIALAQKLLRFVETLPGKPLFTKRHGIWKILEMTEAPAAATGQEELFAFEGGRIIRNYDEDRVQILFDGIPSAELRAKLKGAAWKWSPRNQAWQRQNTANAVCSAQQILGLFNQSGQG